MRGVALCGVLDHEGLQKLSALAVDRRVGAGATLFQEGDPADDVFTITSGMLKLIKPMRDGRRQITGFMLPGDFLGLAFGRTYVYSAEAVSESHLCRFSRAEFVALMDRFPALEKGLLGRVSTELAAAQEQMLLLGRKTARERVATFLVSLCRRQGVGSGQKLELAMARSDLADYLGVRTETISRCLTALRKERMIELPDPDHVVVTSLPRLEQAAEG
ncbi:MAG: cyclic nucleotide-binding domain-containing protein [Geminicoccaceae bacterium]